MEYTIMKNSEGIPRQVIMNEDPSFKVDIYELEPHKWDSKEKIVYGINWSACGISSTKVGVDYAELIKVAAKVADELNS